jgi:predicted small lipoprotein YifL
VSGDPRRRRYFSTALKYTFVMSRATTLCTVALILIGTTPLHGCGQTGALFLPTQLEQTPVQAQDSAETDETPDSDSDRAPR